LRTSKVCTPAFHEGVQHLRGFAAEVDDLHRHLQFLQAQRQLQDLPLRAAALQLVNDQHHTARSLRRLRHQVAHAGGVAVDVELGLDAFSTG
jgi:hypothetical protein